MGDSTYKIQPKLMSYETAFAAIEKAAVHCKENQLETFDFVFHGGEPLLAGKEFFKIFIKKARESFASNVALFFSLQTNGVLIDKDWAALFLEEAMNIGVSVDGPEMYHNHFRKYASGKNSFSDVVRGMSFLQEVKHIGVLQVMNIKIPPDIFYNFAKSLPSKSINLLFPEANYLKPPLDDQDYYQKRKTEYGDWLISIYNYWRNDLENRPHIYLFYQICQLILGRKSAGDELLGLRENSTLVIETNGSIEAADSLKAVGDGFTKSKWNIQENDLSDVKDDQLISHYYSSHKALCNKCQTCPIVEVCGGGMLAHRYDSHNKFDNPSIYCFDLIKLITHIQNDIFERLPADLLVRFGIDRTSYYDCVVYNEEMAEVSGDH